ncbi:MAG: peptide chain release factor N(5)-glutamine methyltransferase [Acidobacteriota bacterium]
MTSIADFLESASSYLYQDNHLASRREIVQIISFVLNKSKEYLYANMEKDLKETEMDKILKFIQKRKNGFPLQYIVKKQEFWSLDFKISKGVFIPRPESELIVEKTIELFGKEEGIIVDVGTGCGNIAISIARELPKAKIIGIDVSLKAIKFAQINAKLHKVEDRVEFLKGRFLKPLDEKEFLEKIDIIVSNPPYISPEEWKSLPSEIKKFEPKRTLVSSNNGLSFIKKLINDSSIYVKKGGYLIFEIGNEQGEIIKSFLPNQWKLLKIEKDLANFPRVIILKKQIH